MARPSSVALAIVAFMIALFLSATAHGHWKVGLGDLSSMWVAAGTLALAGMTWWSVSRTNAVISGEDRRHQQGFAPLLVLKTQSERLTLPQGASFPIQRTVIVNEGIGLALRVNVWYHTPKIHSTHALGAVAPGAHIQINGLNQEESTSPVRLEYSDMFGNLYETYYEKGADHNKYEWKQPRHLKLPRP